MQTYHITYYYLATGMDGNADIADYGYINAQSAEDAISKMGVILHPNNPNAYKREWGLSARKVLSVFN